MGINQDQYANELADNGNDGNNNNAILVTGVVDTKNIHNNYSSVNTQNYRYKSTMKSNMTSAIKQQAG